MLGRGSRPVSATFRQFLPFSPHRMQICRSQRHRRDVAEVATLRAQQTPELLRVPLLN